MKVTNVNDTNIIVVESPTQQRNASLFMRLQEFYESPFENIKGKYFTLDQYMDTYADHNDKEFTYLTDWNGFNVPGDVVSDFFIKFGGNLRAKEVELFGELKLHIQHDKRFYVIGIIEGSAPSLITHETAHAMWCLDEDYRREMYLLVGNLKRNFLDKCYVSLREGGYCDDVLMDEVQAYFATSTSSYLRTQFNIRASKKILEQFKEVFDRYYPKYSLTQTNG